MVLTRDVRRFVTSGAYRPVADMVPGLQTVDAVSADGTVEKQIEDACVLVLYRHFLFLLCALSLDIITTTRILAEGQKLLVLSNSIDTDSRMILQDEQYLVNSNGKHNNLVHSPALVASLDAFHSKQSRSWFASGISPFTAFKFTRPPSLLASTERTPCPKCRKPCSLYCSACLVPTLPEELQIPEVKLPLHVDMLVRQYRFAEEAVFNCCVHCR